MTITPIPAPVPHLTAVPTPSPSLTPEAVAPLASAADWWMVALTALGIVVTAGVALLTLRATRIAEASRKVGDAAQVRALEAYVEASNASRESLDRQVEALNKVTAASEFAPVDEKPTTDVQWDLQRDVGRGRWLFRNVGTATAYSATIKGLTEQDSTDLMVFSPEPRDVDPIAYIQFLIERSLASPPATAVVVKWSDDLGNERSKTFVVT